MAALGDMVTSAQIAASIGRMRFDRQITAFNFQPSLGIVAKDIDRFAADIRSMREPLRRSIKQVMVPSIRRNFAVGGRPAWEPLAPNTIRKRGTAWPILVRTGALRRTATTIKVWTITQAAATIKDLPDKVWYGKVHQAGQAGDQFSGGNWFGKYERAARKVLGPDEDDKTVNELAFKMFDKRLLQHGPAPRTKIPEIPARPFAVFQDEDLDRIQDIFGDWLIERLERVGRWGG